MGRVHVLLALLTGVVIGQLGQWYPRERHEDGAIVQVGGCDPARGAAHGQVCGPAPAAEVPAEVAASAVPTSGAPPSIAAPASAAPASAAPASAAPASAPPAPARHARREPVRRPPPSEPSMVSADDEDAPPRDSKPERQEVARRALQWTASIRGDGYYGAGVVVDKRGYVLTCQHVIKDMKDIRVSFPDTGELPAKVLDQDEDLDLALLDVGTPRPVAAPLASFVNARAGDDVLTMGSPRRMDFTVTWGIVSYVGRRMVGHYFLQTDITTNGGNSGGPVVNGRGEVIGVMSFNLRQSEGLSFATPIDVAAERFSRILGNNRLDLGGFRDWLQARADGPHKD
jgi:S1-C subfamily serine protease